MYGLVRGRRAGQGLARPRLVGRGRRPVGGWSVSRPRRSPPTCSPGGRSLNI